MSHRRSLFQSRTIRLMVCAVIGCVSLVCFVGLYRHGFGTDTQSDSVDRETTLSFLKDLRPGTDLPEPGKAGRQYASTDIAAGIQRILYFGPTWSAGKPLIDKKTGYPVEIVAGCVVTHDFVVFVESYNTAMRVHFAAAVRVKGGSDPAQASRSSHAKRSMP